MKKTFMAIIISLMFVGCAAIDRVGETNVDIAVSYATLKVIERDNDISGNDVIRVMDEIDAVVSDEDVALDKLKMEAMRVIGYDQLALSDRFLVEQVLDRVEGAIKTRYENSFEDHSEVRIRLKELIDTVHESALMSKKDISER